MLVSDKYGFVIATPVKTGTTTLLGMADSWKRQGGSSKVLRAFSGDPVTKHRMCPPEGCEDYDRFITIRNPETRIPSMYEWMRKWEHPAALHNAIWDAEERKGRAEGWRQFVVALSVIRAADGYHDGGKRRKGTRQPYMWTDTQEEHHNFLMGRDVDGSLLPWYREEVAPQTLDCEELETEWGQLLTEYGVDEDALYDLRVPHLNKSRDRLVPDGSADGYWELLGGREKPLFTELARPDAEFFGWPWLDG